MSTPAKSDPTDPERPLLARPSAGRMVGGVAAAFARRFGVDVTWIRLGWVLLAVLFGTGFLAYLICWLVIPEE